MTTPTTGGWLGRLAARGGGRAAAEEASPSPPQSASPAAHTQPSSAHAPTASASPHAVTSPHAPSPETQAKAAATKAYIENMYRERERASAARLERRKSMETEASHGALSSEERAGKLAELERREAEYARLRRQKMSVDDFEPLTIIGRGAFGEARLLLAACRFALLTSETPGANRARARLRPHLRDEEAEEERDGPARAGAWALALLRASL